MTGSTVPIPERLPIKRQDSMATGAWAMRLVIATEAALFAYLLFSYFYVGATTGGHWPPSGTPELKLALPNTLLLLLSSGTMGFADSSIARDHDGRLRLGLLATLILGITFLAIQMVEYSHLRFAPQTNAYGSLFFTITGFHAAHVVVGLLMIAFVLARAIRGDFSGPRHLAVTTVGWYWHFVDIVWLAVFATLYLSPRFV
jgi:heme/copper-type cytochrome/quinol oxidase subunit 3